MKAARAFFKKPALIIALYGLLDITVIFAVEISISPLYVPGFTIIVSPELELSIAF